MIFSISYCANTFQHNQCLSMPMSYYTNILALQKIEYSKYREMHFSQRWCHPQEWMQDKIRAPVLAAFLKNN